MIPSRRSRIWQAHLLSAECLWVRAASILLPFRSLAENRRAHTHKSRAFLDGDRKILRHSHGKMRKFHIEFFFERIPQFAQLNKKFPGAFGFFRERRNTHQSLDRQSR